VRTLDPSRIFHYTTADKGSAHIYRDMEPVWYRHIYNQLPFLAESGIHSFPNFRTIKKLISEKESTGILPDLSSEEFGKNFPELINHFSEYIPIRIPRMLARASQVTDLNKYTLEDICEATQVQAYEFYQLMIQSMRENYPVCGGIMPWVFKRPWTTTAIQTVDGMGLPTYPYYAVKNSYSGINICLCQQWSVTAPYEEIPVSVKIFNETVDTLEGSIINVTIYSPDMSIAKEHTQAVSQEKTEYNFESFKPDDKYIDKSFLICADITKDNTILSRSTYFVKCTSILADRELYKKHRSEPSENLHFKNGGQLKPTIVGAQRASLEAKFINTGTDGRYVCADIEITNNSKIGAFPVTV
jgi:beta-mannosidase